MESKTEVLSYKVPMGMCSDGLEYFLGDYQIPYRASSDGKNVRFEITVTDDQKELVLEFMDSIELVSDVLYNSIDSLVEGCKKVLSFERDKNVKLVLEKRVIDDKIELILKSNLDYENTSKVADKLNKFLEDINHGESKFEAIYGNTWKAIIWNI